MNYDLPKYIHVRRWKLQLRWIVGTYKVSYNMIGPKLLASVDHTRIVIWTWVVCFDGPYRESGLELSCLLRWIIPELQFGHRLLEIQWYWFAISIRVISINRICNSISERTVIFNGSHAYWDPRAHSHLTLSHIKITFFF